MPHDPANVTDREATTPWGFDRPNAHQGQAPRSFRVAQMARASKSFHVLVLGGVLLVGGPLLEPLGAESGLPYPGGSKIAFEWQYSCSNGKNCSFSCPGTGGASHVTKLSIHLGTIPLGDTEKVGGIFYEFSTMEIPRANGFSLTTGISTLSCQVNGMNLDYSGPPRTNSLSAAR
jgi:hypothetical protein